jgi:hypothetical protein
MLIIRLAKKEEAKEKVQARKTAPIQEEDKGIKFQRFLSE